LPVYSVVVNGKNFSVEVEEIGKNRFRVRVHGKEEIIELTEKAREIRHEKKAEETSSKLGGGEIKAEMSGSIVRVLVSRGDRVEKGQPLIVLEAMKMENEVPSPVGGTVQEVLVSEGDKVQAGDILIVIAPESGGNPVSSQTVRSTSEDGNVVKAEMAGTVVRVLKKEGENVKSGEAVIILEAMKMENEISSPSDGRIFRIFVDEGKRVQIGDPLFSLS